jgi:hypothetical protein
VRDSALEMFEREPQQRRLERLTVPKELELSEPGRIPQRDQERAYLLGWTKHGVSLHWGLESLERFLLPDPL